MKKKIRVLTPRISREHLANPFKESYKKRLIKSGAIDLRDNHTIIDLGNGYLKIEPIEKNKKIK